jgi:hypothetical protein
MPQIELQVREDGVHAEDAPNRTHGHARRFVQHEHVVVPVKHPRRGRRYRRYASRRTHHSITEPGPPPTGCDEHRLVDESDAPRLPRAPSTEPKVIRDRQTTNNEAANAVTRQYSIIDY